MRAFLRAGSRALRRLTNYKFGFKTFGIAPGLLAAGGIGVAFADEKDRWSGETIRKWNKSRNQARQRGIQFVTKLTEIFIPDVDPKVEKSSVSVMLQEPARFAEMYARSLQRLFKNAIYGDTINLQKASECEAWKQVN